VFRCCELLPIQFEDKPLSVSLSLIALAGINGPAITQPEMPEPVRVTAAATSMDSVEKRYAIKDSPVLPANLTLRQISRKEVPGESRWLSNFEHANAEAQRLGVPLVVHFAAPWCVPCQKMEREVLNGSELKQLFGRDIVAVKVDGPSNQELLEQFSVLAYPSDVLISTDGNVIARRQGFQSADGYLTLLKHLAASREIQGEYGVKDGPLTTLPEPIDDDAPRCLKLENDYDVIGLAGYSPVALKKDKVWHRGDADITCVFQGVTYRFASREEQTEFESAPEDFVPGFHGCDPVQLVDESRPIPGRVRIGAVYEDRMYFFDSVAAREMFKLNPQKYARSTRMFAVNDLNETLTSAH
jgi:YHS domain-containing protein